MEAALLIIREDSHPGTRGADIQAGRPSCEKSAKSGVGVMLICGICPRLNDLHSFMQARA